MNEVLVSVVMSVYNGEKYLNEAIDSILNQTFKNFEFIIINDASTDSSKSKILAFSDARIRLIDNDINLGLTRSLNKGISLATGKYIARMDADDISEPERLITQVKFLEKNPDICFCGSWFWLLGEKEVITIPENDAEIRANLLRKNQFAHPTMMFRREIFDAGIRYNESLLTSQDYELWTRLILQYKGANVPVPLLKYRMHCEQVTYNHKSMVSERTRDIMKNYALQVFKNTINMQEAFFHTSVMLLEYTGNIAEVLQSNSWISKLIDINSCNGFLDKKAFLKFANELKKDIALQFLMKNFFDKKAYSLHLLFNFFCLPISITKKANTNTKVRFIIKCFLHYKK